MLVTAGGLDRAGGCWVASRNPAFLLPCRALSVIFRAKVRDALRKEQLIEGVRARTWCRRWVVHCQHAGSGEKVLEYLGRYVHRIAIANSSIENVDGKSVTFRYRDNRTRAVSRCRLDAIEFVRRFLQHVLPRRFVKVRSYGLYSTSCRPALEHAREALVRASQGEVADGPRSGTTNHPERTCPFCGVGRMHVVAELPRIWPAGAPPSVRAPP